MKRRACIALGLLLAARPALAAGPAVMTLVYADYAPYSWEEEGRATGLEVEVLEEALGHRLGLTLVHKVLPWKRAQQAVREGQADAFVATRNAERASYADAGNEPVTFWAVSLFYRKGDPRLAGVHSVEELPPALRVGSMIGNGWVAAHLQGREVQYVSGMALLPGMLAAGHIDVVPDNPFVMHHLLRGREEAAQIGETQLPQYSEPMVLHIGRHSAFRDRLAAADEALRRMRADGTLQRLRARYHE